MSLTAALFRTLLLWHRRPYLDHIITQIHGPHAVDRAEAPLEDVAALLAGLLAARMEPDAVFELPLHCSSAETLLAARMEPPMAAGDLVAAACRLGAQRLLLADAGGRRLRMRVALNVAPADAGPRCAGRPRSRPCPGLRRWTCCRRPPSHCGSAHCWQGQACRGCAKCIMLGVAPYLLNH